ncbi:MFS transporter [Sphingobium fuliginis ATCC 27551]|uniref:MFS transporter n=1 Tax=Sphingobium fuliginis ATCC 27551 TaxID=1208342 RepID=A0A5B8CCI6_SPHSA|nr:MFS transporter [Sphingobium fuliginis ATCC 27551]
MRTNINRRGELEKSPVDLAARHILPTLALCVFVNIVDRTNVGIAALNMRADIGLSASAYGMAAGLFYIGFFFAGVPANLLLARIGARRWIAALLVAWGLIAIATGFISDAGSFYAVRLALGIAEAGFVPAIVYYLAQWFDRRAMSKVMGLMIAMMPASLAIGAPLTTGLLMAVDWRWLFIIEGAPAFLVAILVLKSLPERIDDAPWLSDDQKKALSARLMADGAHRQAGSWRDALTHPQVLLLSLQYFCIGLSSQAIIFWFPRSSGRPACRRSSPGCSARCHGCLRHCSRRSGPGIQPRPTSVTGTPSCPAWRRERSRSPARCSLTTARFPGCCCCRWALR